jgi:hypothetical protein
MLSVEGVLSYSWKKIWSIPAFLAYEGPPRPVYIFGTVHDGYRIKARIVGRGQIVMAESTEQNADYARSTSLYEQVVVLRAERTHDLDNLETDAVIATFTAPFDCVIGRAQVCALQELDLYNGLHAMVDFQTDTISGVYQVPLDRYGIGYVEYDDDDILIAGETVSAVFTSDAPGSDPAGLTMILYLKPSYTISD